jgi:ribonuclease HI
LIHGLNIAISLDIKRLMVYGDSLVVISQINKEWDCSNDSMGKYCTVIRKLEDKFEGLEFHHVERDRNAAADALSKLGSVRLRSHLESSSKKYCARASHRIEQKSAIF